MIAALHALTAFLDAQHRATAALLALAARTLRHSGGCNTVFALLLRGLLLEALDRMPLFARARRHRAALRRDIAQRFAPAVNKGGPDRLDT